MLGLSRGGEHAPPAIGSPIAERGSFTRGNPAHAARPRKRVSSLLSPAPRDERGAPAPKGAARTREGPCVERSTDGMALHLSSGQPEVGRGPAGKPACSGPRGEDGGQGRQPRAGRGIDGSSGVPACRYRVAEIGCRDRGPEKRKARPLRSRQWNRVGRRRGLHLEVSIVDLRRKTSRRKAARRKTARRKTGRPTRFE